MSGKLRPSHHPGSRVHPPVPLAVRWWAMARRIRQGTGAVYAAATLAFVAGVANAAGTPPAGGMAGTTRLTGHVPSWVGFAPDRGALADDEPIGRVIAVLAR